MKLHHATAKRASEAGVEMIYDDTRQVWTATKGGSRWDDEHAPTALDACIFAAYIAAELPALRLDYDTRWNVHHQSSPDTEPVWSSEKVPTIDDIPDIQEACDELELDIEEGYEEEDDRKSGSVVDAAYKRQYAEAGHPNNNGDWLSNILDGQNGEIALMPKIPNPANAKKTVADVERYYVLFTDNGITVEDQNFSNAYFNRAPRRNGWEGRFAMSGRNMLRRKVADAGHLIAFGETIEAPAYFCDQHRTKRKARKAKGEEA